MARTRLYRLAALAFAALAAPLAVLLAVPAANAAVVGKLTVTPPTGTDSSLITITTSAGCPSPATNVVGYVLGAGFPTSEPFANIVGNQGIGTFPADPTTGGIAVPLSGTLQSVAAEQNPPAKLSGAYDLHLVCRAALLPTSLGDFTATITFNNPGGTATPGHIPYTSGGPTTSPSTTSPTSSPTTTSPAPTATSTSATPTPTNTGIGGGNESLGVTVGGGSHGSGSGGGSAGRGGRLAATGAGDIPGLILFGLWLVAVGAIVVALGRSRRADHRGPAARGGGGR